MEFICSHCEKSCKNPNSLRNHERLCKKNPNKQESSLVKHYRQKIADGERVHWNKGLTKQDERVARYAAAVSVARTGKPGMTHTPESKAKLSKIAKANGLGGKISCLWQDFVKKDGTVVRLQSSYEIRYATFLEERDINWIRPGPLPWIDDQNISHMYYPDFYLVDYDIYVDTKNDYLIVKDAPKIAAVCKKNNVTVKVISKHELDCLPDLNTMPG